MRYLWFCVIVFVFAESADAQGSLEATAASYVDRGNAWLTKGELDRAIADFNLALEFNRSAVALCNRGMALSKKGYWEAALTDFDGAIELDPRLPQAYVGRGEVRYRKGDLDGAISDNTKVVELKPSLAAPWNNRGIARRGKGRLGWSACGLRSLLAAESQGRLDLQQSGRCSAISWATSMEPSRIRPRH